MVGMLVFVRPEGGGGSSRRQLRINGTGSYIYILVINVQCLNEIVKKEKIKHEKM